VAVGSVTGGGTHGEANVMWELVRTPLGAAFVGVLGLLLLAGHRVEAETSRTSSEVAWPETGPMVFKGDLSLQGTVDYCITGMFQPAAIDSNFILFKPLAPGHHTITRCIVTTKGTVTGPNTTEIDVLGDR